VKIYVAAVQALRKKEGQVPTFAILTLDRVSESEFTRGIIELLSRIPDESISYVTWSP
jgi:hypothetical protein